MRKLQILALWLLCGILLPLSTQAYKDWIYTWLVDENWSWVITVIWSGIEMTLKAENQPWTYRRWNNIAQDSTTYNWSENNNIRWWWNDSYDNWFTQNPSNESKITRRWPCDTWYHVPSRGEWNDFVTAWCNLTTWCYLTDSSDQNKNSWSNKLIYISVPWMWTKFKQDFNMTSYDNFFWSSSPNPITTNLAWNLYMSDNEVRPNSGNGRNSNYRVRCLKNSIVAPDPSTLNLSFISENVEVWTWEVTEDEIYTGTVPNKIETGYILEYRYLSGWDTTTGFDFENEAITWGMADESGNVYFIAQWTGIKYSVEFTWTDVEWTMPNQEFTYGIAQNLTANTFTKNWYTFSGWTDWTTWYTDGQEVVNLTTTSEDVITLTAQWTKIETKPSWGSSGWGGRSRSSNDRQISPDPSLSRGEEDSSLIKEGDREAVEDLNSNTPMDSSDKSSEWQEILSPSDSSFTKEQKDAYEFAKEKWITTMPTIQEAQMDGKLTRIAMAKMLSYYAINVLWQKPDETRINKFNDITNKLDAQYDSGVTLAYQLWIMWINMPDNNFRPNDEVTRAEFATALSRMLYSTPDGKPYYTTHLEKLKAEKIITNDDYKMKELRGYVMIMLMRSAK